MKTEHRHAWHKAAHHFARAFEIFNELDAAMPAGSDEQLLASRLATASLRSGLRAATQGHKAEAATLGIDLDSYEELTLKRREALQVMDLATSAMTPTEIHAYFSGTSTVVEPLSPAKTTSKRVKDLAKGDVVKTLGGRYDKFAPTWGKVHRVDDRPAAIPGNVIVDLVVSSNLGDVLLPELRDPDAFVEVYHHPAPWDSADDGGQA